mmetsp:Transcript_5017/g.4215  ORF Transcript_5017/g.4215 Transcript_5017/m.4215 type:complete len:122 (-) Transcript_5017:764-1129(-)
MEDFELKLTDFDLSRAFENPISETTGTEVYRAPEVREGQASLLEMADIYSLGILLFSLKARGRIPFSENRQKSTGLALYQKIFDKPLEFWNLHCRALNVGKDYFDDEFKELITQMLHPDPE